MSANLAQRDKNIVAASAAGQSPKEIAFDQNVSLNVVKNVLRDHRRQGRALVPVFREGALLPYDAACRALAEAKAVDEVMEVADKAAAMKEYARRAKNKQLEVDAAEIRIRAERRLGELIQAQKESVGLARPGPKPEIGSAKEPNSIPTLADIGVDKKLSSRAQRLAAMPEDDFAWQLSDWRRHAEAEGERVSVRLVKGEAAQDKRARRETRERALGEKIAALPTKKYGVILEDFEWDFEVRSRITGMDRHASNHYPTAADAHSAEEIVARTAERFECAAPDCFLAMWAPVPHLAIALEVMRLRGFAYVSSAVWLKYRPGGGIGPGWWFRVDHELILCGVKGAVPCPAHGEQWRSVFDIPASRTHSQKPDDIAEMLENYFPHVPKIELNRRGAARPGWDAWGNEAEPSGNEPTSVLAAVLDRDLNRYERLTLIGEPTLDHLPEIDRLSGKETDYDRLSRLAALLSDVRDKHGAAPHPSGGGKKAKAEHEEKALAAQLVRDRCAVVAAKIDARRSALVADAIRERGLIQGDLVRYTEGTIDTRTGEECAEAVVGPLSFSRKHATAQIYAAGGVLFLTPDDIRKRIVKVDQFSPEGATEVECQSTGPDHDERRQLEAIDADREIAPHLVAHLRGRHLVTGPMQKPRLTKGGKKRLGELQAADRAATDEIPAGPHASPDQRSAGPEAEGETLDQTAPVAGGAAPLSRPSSGLTRGPDADAPPSPARGEGEAPYSVLEGWEDLEIPPHLRRKPVEKAA